MKVGSHGQVGVRNPLPPLPEPRLCSRSHCNDSGGDQVPEIVKPLSGLQQRSLASLCVRKARLKLRILH